MMTDPIADLFTRIRNGQMLRLPRVDVPGSKMKKRIVEILKDREAAKQGEVGEIVITDLNNYCMPLIRYRIGDLAKSLGTKDCDCGRGLPLIGDIQGRVQSIIIGANGKYLPGTYFSHLFKTPC